MKVIRCNAVQSDGELTITISLDITPAIADKTSVPRDEAERTIMSAIIADPGVSPRSIQRMHRSLSSTVIRSVIESLKKRGTVRETIYYAPTGGHPKRYLFPA